MRDHSGEDREPETDAQRGTSFRQMTTSGSAPDDSHFTIFIARDRVAEGVCRDANYFAGIGCANTSRCPFRSITSNSIIP
jgi:hypothetical protein